MWHYDPTLCKQKRYEHIMSHVNDSFSIGPNGYYEYRRNGKTVMKYPPDSPDLTEAWRNIEFGE